MKKLNNKKLLYVSMHNIDKDPGVEKKIQGTCRAAEDKGFEIERITRYCRSIKARRELMDNVLKTDAKYIIFRSFGTLTIFVYAHLRKLRVNGHILICDQATPMSIVLKEIWISSKPTIKKIVNIIRGYISGPWSMWQYHRIIQYAPESKYFSFGNKNKTLLIGNGIDINRVNLRIKKEYSDQKNIRLVGVANVSPHHGFDRVIRAIALYNEKYERKAYFSIIGGNDDSPIILSLKKIAKDLGVSDYIHVHGWQDKDFINSKYNESDLAVGSLGLFRIKLNIASILKVREYCLAGIPFITAAEDPDFSENVPFQFIVPNDGSIKPILKVLEEFPQKRNTFTDEQIRRYAIENLSFDKKLTLMLEGLS